MGQISKPRAASLLRKLLNFDKSFHELLPDVVIGLDEVGRGCLAGPVVAAAVSLPDVNSALAKRLRTLDDSKKVSAKEREVLSAIIREHAIYAIGEASVEEINDLNIVHASLLAMKRARRMIKAIPHAVLLIDGNMTIAGLSDPQVTVVKGDSKSASIAAASIVAKVHRDELMCKLSTFFPEYKWHKNKGYGSKDHLNAIEQHGPTTWHRKAFLKDGVDVEENIQLDLFSDSHTSR